MHRNMLNIHIGDATGQTFNALGGRRNQYRLRAWKEHIWER